MISVEDAQQKLLNLVKTGDVEKIDITHAKGRILAQDIIATRAAPPFDASAMDGYAIKRKELKEGASFTLIGESAAGKGFSHALREGEAVQILTGAPLPKGADMVLIQEHVMADDMSINVIEPHQLENFIRKKASDYDIGFSIKRGVTLTPALISHIASMGVWSFDCFKKPEIALISTGDELVPPGNPPNEDQIFSSNCYGLKALFEQAGAKARILPIARDDEAHLKAVFNMAFDADLIITTGGASVGRHDLVMDVAQMLGLKATFHKVRMRPGKPLMAGQFENSAFVGLPGNPVSALLCAHIFILPMIRKMLGCACYFPQVQHAFLTHDLEKNGERAHYMRARYNAASREITIFEKQDSALLTVLTQSNALAIRAPNEKPLKKGSEIPFLEFS